MPDINAVTCSFFLEPNIESYEKKLNDALDSGEIDKINEHVTPRGLSHCETNTLTKALQVCKLYAYGYTSIHLYYLIDL